MKELRIKLALIYLLTSCAFMKIQIKNPIINIEKSLIFSHNLILLRCAHYTFLLVSIKTKCLKKVVIVLT